MSIFFKFFICSSIGYPVLFACCEHSPPPPPLLPPTPHLPNANHHFLCVGEPQTQHRAQQLHRERVLPHGTSDSERIGRVPTREQSKHLQNAAFLVSILGPVFRNRRPLMRSCRFSSKTSETNSWHDVLVLMKSFSF